MSKHEARQQVDGAEQPEAASAKDHLCPARTNLKQWRMLHAVVELGSFAGAAEFLNVSQATVSYTIARLEEELGVSILKMEGRKYRLTEIGQDFLQRSKVLLRTVIALERYADDVRQGAVPEVKVAVAQCFPTRFIMPTIRRFSAHWRHAKVRLIEVPQTDVERVLYENSADIVINKRVPTGYTGNVLIELEYVAVASPDHSLFQKCRELTQDDLCREVEQPPFQSDTVLL